MNRFLYKAAPDLVNGYFFSLKVKEESEKVGLKLNIQKTKIMASGPMLVFSFASCRWLLIVLERKVRKKYPLTPMPEKRLQGGRFPTLSAVTDPLVFFASSPAFHSAHGK